MCIKVVLKKEKKRENDHNESTKEVKKGSYLCHMNIKIIPTKERKKENDTNESKRENFFKIQKIAG
jgi:hypothetical protein